METSRAMLDSSVVSQQPWAASTNDDLLSPEIANQVLRRALGGRGHFAEIYAEERISAAISTDGGHIERVTSGLQRGAGIRVAASESIGMAFTESLEPSAMLAAADAARDAALGIGRPRAAVAGSRAPTSSPVMSFKNATNAQRVELVLRGDQAAWAADPRIQQVTVFLGTIQQRIVVANSEGLYGVDRRPRLRYRVQVVARGAGEKLGLGTYAPGVTRGFDFLEQVSPETIATTAVSQALAQLEAGPAPAGRMPVVLGPGVGGVLVHEACGHGLEADSVLRGGSIFAGRIGESVASEQVTIVDDATVPGAWGSFAIDDEGGRAQRSLLIENGYVRRFLSDTTTAASLKEDPTGNGRRASFRHLPLPRMTNTFILPAHASPQAIIEDTSFGLYAKSLSAGQVNPTSGAFLFTVREGYLIRNGRLDHPVIGATVAGHALDALRQLDAVGNDLEVVAGNCAREGQRVFVGIGQPTIRINALLVGGTTPAGWSQAVARLASSRAWRGLESETEGAS
jgi:TldD protein